MATSLKQRQCDINGMTKNYLKSENKEKNTIILFFLISINFDYLVPNRLQAIILSCDNRFINKYKHQCTKSVNPSEVGHDIEGSFSVCTQPMRDGVTLQCHLSMAVHIHRMIPVYNTEMFGRNMNICLHFIASLHTEMMQTDETLCYGLFLGHTYLMHGKG